jgi:hypothetical protein
MRKQPCFSTKQLPIPQKFPFLPTPQVHVLAVEGEGGDKELCKTAPGLPDSLQRDRYRPRGCKTLDPTRIGCS